MNIGLTSAVGPRVFIEGRQRDYFSGTGYLGLQSHPEVLQAAQDCIQRYGLSTATSRGGYGEHPIYTELEAELRAFFNVEKAVFFASGYLGATILTQGLNGEFDRVFFDEHSHFSILDAAKAAGKPAHSFPHLDIPGLRSILKRDLPPGERPLILSDGVFPISGEIAPLPGLLQTAEDYGGWLVVDDAHAAGVLGAHGQGTADFYDIPQNTHLLTSATLSKALGGFGGVITGPAALIDRLDRRSRIMIASSPPPLPAAAASARALAIARLHPQLRAGLAENVAQARTGLRSLGWNLVDSPVPIVCLGVRPGISLQRIRDELYQRDICIAHVLTYSSTPSGGALRIAIFANHSHQQIERLIHEMAQILKT